MPRSFDGFIKGTYLQENGGKDFNLLHGLGENAVGTQSGSILSVEAPTGSFKDYNQLAKEAEAYGHDPEDVEDAFPVVRDNDGRVVYERNKSGDGRSPVKQGVLFQDTRRPPIVSSLVSTKDARHMTPAMLEAANKESLKRWQQPVTQGDDPNLSVHSRPMVNRLIRAGLAPGPETEVVNNNYDWNLAHERIQEVKKYYDEDKSVPIDSDEFSQGGRDFVKRLSAAEKARGIKSKPAEPKSWRVGERYYSNQEETDEGLMRKMSNSGRRNSFQDELPGMNTRQLRSEYAGKLMGE
jgi:hypothetical protein